MRSQSYTSPHYIPNRCCSSATQADLRPAPPEPRDTCSCPCLLRARGDNWGIYYRRSAALRRYRPQQRCAGAPLAGAAAAVPQTAKRGGAR